MNKTQPWIFSAKFDGWLFLGPAFVVTAIVIVFNRHLESLQGVPPWLWLILIVGIDVGHVYSTIFRTYLDKNELKKRQALYTLAPIGVWIFGCFLYSINSLFFWRALAYLAVFHFVRQQYGFMMIYARKERDVPSHYKFIDKSIIYMATIYPLIYWHANTREFEWFINDDFFVISNPLINSVALLIYIVLIFAYVAKEIKIFRRDRNFNIPKNLLLFGTAISWFVGIVAFNNDLAFTATNVIAHGIPYIALIWLYGHNQTAIQKETQYSYIWPSVSKLFQWKAVPLYIGILFLIAFIEEFFWDGLIWREHATLFMLSDSFPAITDANTLVWLVPLLALPQATHYILDAFIWRFQTDGTDWKDILFHQTSGKK